MRLFALTIVMLSGCQAEQPSFDAHQFKPNTGAEFRFVARQFLEAMSPDCEITKHRDSLKKIEKIESDWNALKQKNASNSLAIEIAISEADTEIELSARGVPDCPDPDINGKDPDLANYLWKLGMLMTLLNDIADVYPAKWTPKGE